MIQSIEYKGNMYKYDDDLSYEKWRDFIFSDLSNFERIDFILHKVVVDIDLDVVDAVLATDIARAVIAILGLNEVKLTKTRKSMGKAVRGIYQKDYAMKAVQLEIMRSMNGSIRLDDFRTMSILDFLFLQRYVDELHTQEQEAMETAMAQMQAVQSKAK
jgi:hypothetical protein